MGIAATSAQGEYPFAHKSGVKETAMSFASPSGEALLRAQGKAKGHCMDYGFSTISVNGYT
ncbi:MAG: hypothetical protein JWQ24_5200 [Tardiphaga sp.]|nr:hypothetical protein [Tardiphaga sp.]